MIISKKVSFDAAHFLPNYNGKCKDLHGHHWVVEVACRGEVDERTGMVIDFKDLKEWLRLLEETFDHKLVNDIITNPTAENICSFVYEKFEIWCVSRKVEIDFVRIWETEDSMAELRRRY